MNSGPFLIGWNIAVDPAAIPKAGMRFAFTAIQSSCLRISWLVNLHFRVHGLRTRLSRRESPQIHDVAHF
jgi:hypothetical protein